MFIDRIKIYAKAGDGGNGAISFRREKYVSHGGPDGGDGGNGGNIVFRVDEGTNTLLAFRYKRKFVAANGGNGSGAKFHGATADDVVITVPLGTLIRDAGTGRIIKDMSDHEDFICCRGGRGGWGNKHFATPTRQVPNFAKNGTKGEEKELLLELKMIADVGLIGFPSVGKSSILAAISSARPKIAEYHFTTLEPNLGVVSIDGEGRGFVAADIPGLIEGAADGAGLGHEFLRHVDRCRLLLHVVDIARTEERDPIEDIKKINSELERYSPELASRPQMIVANKCDILDPEITDIEAFEKFVAENGWELIYISAATGENMKQLVRRVSEKLADLPPVKIYDSEEMPKEITVDEERKTDITRENNKFYVEGEWLYNLMGQINFDDYESLNYFGKVLQKSGVYEMLEEKGCRDGDTVSIYDFEFDYVK
ncbi:MAG: GTPase ObgE [Clostridia bacterium]|nr:GTPase ObgE [Clostridia bacterium]MDY3785035.1 GTPase ObgE [Eubacteriales bacterium]